MKKTIAIVGAGHAGFEAAMAAARLGIQVLMFAMHLDSVGNLPCNPSIGGVAKGQIVREIDALGGEMAKAADACCIQLRMLNRGKGPAVRSPRSQTDRHAYTLYVKKTLENHPNILLRQNEICDILLTDGRVCAVVDTLGTVYEVQAALLATGTFLQGRTITGSTIREGGPDGLQAARGLSGTLARLEVPLRRFKTGTPARIHARTVDFSQMAEQPGEADVPNFSFDAKHPLTSHSSCYLTWTNERTHDIFRANLHRSPLYNGVIDGVGPRYCPSIEDKVVRFAHKTRHPIFVEPMGRDTSELYLQGFSSSMPVEVQLEALHTVKGLERAEMTRPGYAIEYDCLDPLCLAPTLMVRHIPGLFAAGQFCGSSGYEEAAGQGLLAGINAVHYLLDKPPVILSRASSYIGTLIDDLVTRGTEEPYRMMTSRSEYRLLLRHDNADQRLLPLGHELGLVDETHVRRLADKVAAIAAEMKRITHVTVPPSEALNAWLESLGETGVDTGAKLDDLLRRPPVHYEALAPFDPTRPVLDPTVCEQVEIETKYEGYIKRQQTMLESMNRLEHRRIPPELAFDTIPGLSTEAVQKLSKLRPLSLGQAGRISGVSPADITALMLHIT